MANQISSNIIISQSKIGKIIAKYHSAFKYLKINNSTTEISKQNLMVVTILILQKAPKDHVFSAILIGLTGKQNPMSTYQELLNQKAALDQQIAVARKAQAKQALETVHELIAEFGFTAQQVFPWKPVVKSVAAKYRDPLTGASWSGRGRAPKWIEGKNRAEFLV